MNEKVYEMLNEIKAFDNKTFCEIIDSKKVIIFGTGTGSENFIKKYKILPAYFVDNNADKWGDNFCERMIYNPNIIEEEDYTKIFILVPSVYYNEISTQLNKMGLRENINYTDALNIENTLYLKKYEYEQEAPKLTEKNLEDIEKQLRAELNVVEDWYIDIDDFNKFKSKYIFDKKYLESYGNVSTEKILEHYVAYRLLDLEQYTKDDIYIDVAACSSPWAKILREKDITAYAIDLKVSELYCELPYYIKLDATSTNFHNNSIMGMSLQCAYEMFLKDDDINFIKEASRVLKKGGKVIISPLYLHKLYCSTCSPDYFGKGYSDKNAIEFIRKDYFGIPSSRKYDVENLMTRVLDTADKYGLKYKIYIVKNKKDVSQDIYLNYVLELKKF